MGVLASNRPAVAHSSAGLFAYPTPTQSHQ
jgi:hypothetical protein